MDTGGEGVVVGGQILVEAGSRGSRYDLLAQAAASLGDVAGETFVPQGRRDSTFFKAERPSSRVTMTLPRFANSREQDNSWLSLAVDTYDPKPIEAVFVSIHMGRLGEQIDIEWEVGLTVMPRLVLELEPTLAFMTAWSLDSEGDLFPPEEPLPGQTLPRKFTVWTYIGPGPDVEAQRALAQLPSVESAPLGGGWLVRAVQHVQDPPPQGFVDALRSLGPTPIDYLPPRLG